MKGRVVDPDGNGLQSVGISVSPYSWVVYTDSTGAFVTPDVSAGSYVLKAERFGWMSEQVTVTAPAGEDVTIKDITLSYGDMDQNGVIDLRDVVSMDDMLGDSIRTATRFFDLDSNGIIDSVEFEELLAGYRNEGGLVDEWAASKPDFVTYVPHLAGDADGTNQHYLVTKLPSGRLFGVWTQAFQESSDNQSVVCHWSDDDGATWTAPTVIDGPQRDGYIASWGFYIVVPNFHRIYVFYNKDAGTRIYHTGRLQYKYSDDWGETWSQSYATAFRRGAYSPADTAVPPSWWAYQNPILVAGKPIGGFTEIQSTPPEIYYSNEIRFMRFDNIMQEPDPAKVQISTFPPGNGLRGAYLANTSRSLLQEPSIVQMSDGRLFCIMRSPAGCPFYSFSSDSGHTWTTPEKLRYSDTSRVIPHPYAPCPLFKLSDGYYVMVFNNNNGNVNGVPGGYLLTRSPSYVTIARENLGATQPLWFSPPVMILDNYFRPFGPQNRTEVATYPSLTEEPDHYVLWYPDRKYFLLGKKLPKPITKLLPPGVVW